MVLDDASADAPPSDFASYYDNFNPDDPQEQPSFQLDLSTLPRPLPIFGRSPQRVQHAIASNVSISAHRLGRMVTQEEFDALAYHSAKAQTILSYGQPLGLAAGAYRCWATRKSYKFPLLKVKEGFNPYTLEFRGWQLLKGIQARNTWHFLRLAAYGSIGVWTLSLVLAGYATSVLAVGELTDPRLKALQDAIRDAAKIQFEQRAAKHKPQGDTGPGNASAGERRGISTWGEDDASPAAGQEGDFAESRAMEARLYGNIDGNTRGAQPVNVGIDITSPPLPEDSAWIRAAKRSKANAEPKPVEGFYDSDDDASPTATDTSSSPTSTSTGGGSAWERLRREATAAEPGNSSARPGRRRPSQVPKDRDEASFSFSSTEDERHLARDQAQKDFDDQVERERQGENFEGNRRGRGW